MKARATFVALALLLPSGCAQAPGAERAISDGRYTMGTVLEISLHGLDRQPAIALLDELYAVAEGLDALLSTHKPDSGVNRLSRSAGRGPQQVEPALAEILALSIAYSDLTLGTFDVTIGPLAELWRAAEVRAARPTASELAEARTRVGVEQIVKVEDGVFSLAREGMKLDFGGIAKGYALDRMLPQLARSGIENALLSFGQSSTWALGAPPGSAGWRLLIRGIDGEYLGLITLRDQALSVSESAGPAVEQGAHHYAHIIDPRSGQPLTEPIQAIVVAPEAALAEALSKALLILGADKGLALLAAQPGCEGALIEASGEWRSTPGWSSALQFERFQK